jgi:hypothetical protein
LFSKSILELDDVSDNWGTKKIISHVRRNCEMRDGMVLDFLDKTDSREYQKFRLFEHSGL